MAVHLLQCGTSFAMWQHLAASGPGAEWVLFCIDSDTLVIVVVVIIIIISRQCLWCCHHGRAIVRVHPVHLIYVERHQVAADPRPGQIRLYTLPESTPTIAIYYYYSARKLIWYSFYRPTEGRRLSRPRWLVTYGDGLPTTDGHQ